jgi:hypothetical protein
MRLVPPQSMIRFPGAGYGPTVPARPAAAAPPPELPAPSATTQVLEELSKLADLKANGVLTDEEFVTLKARILAG